MSAAPLLTPLAAAVLHVGAPERILEIGCGAGEGTLFLAREFPAARVRGVDGCAEAVGRAVARTGLDPEGRVAFKQGDPRSLPFPDDHFDLLAASDTRPHPPEAARVLRRGGFLALAATSAPPVLGGFRGGLLRRRLERFGFEPIWADRAGEGSFLVARLGAGEPPAAAL